MSLQKNYSKYKDSFESEFSLLAESLKEVPEPLCSSMRYSMLSGGKRLRPVLFLACADIFEMSADKQLYKMACAIECIHTYSLIHDDLPCMDNADLRRGKPTNHKVFGECVAVLAGDALLNLAYELMFGAVSECSPELAPRYIRAAKLLSEMSGQRGLIGGQTVDTAIDTDKHIASRLNYIYQHKTADLICASMCAGAIIGGANDTELKNITDAGNNIGYAFQIVDDIIDADSGEDGDKNTFVDVYGVKESRKAVSDRTAVALKSILALGKDVSFLRSLIKKLSIRKK